MANLIDSNLETLIHELLPPQADTRWSTAQLRKNVQELLHVVQAVDFGDSLHRGAPLLDPPTISDTQSHARRWRRYECDKIEADIYRAQERTPERNPDPSVGSGIGAIPG